MHLALSLLAFVEREIFHQIPRILLSLSCARMEGLNVSVEVFLLLAVRGSNEWALT